MSRPNVLVLLTDQQAASTIEPGSPCRMPNVNQVANDGVRFERAYCPNPICSPSRASMLTGVLPHVHGMTNVTHGVEPYGARFRDNLDTWSERLAADGYHLGYFGKWHIERSGDLGKFGFDNYEIVRSDEFQNGYAAHRRDLGLPETPTDSPANLEPSRTISDPGYEDFLLYGVRDEPPEGTEEYYLYSQGIDFVERAAEHDDPWCAVVSTPGPHDPYLPPASVYEEYDSSGIPTPENFDDDLKDKPEIYRRQREVWADLTPDEYAEATACYYAFCTHIDDQIGRILDALRTTDQLDNTVIVYASDHGDLMGAHGLFLKGIPAFEETYRIPLLIRHPDGTSGQVRDELVQLHDLAPTLVDLAGGDGTAFPPESRMEVRNPHARGGEAIEALDDDPSFTATSLVPFLHGEVPAAHRNEAFAECHAQDFPWCQRVYWRDDLKYVFNTFGRDELYDRAEDPHELRNRVDDEEYEEDVKDLAGRMWQIARETGDYQISELHYGMHRFAPVGPNWRS